MSVSGPTVANLAAPLLPAAAVPVVWTVLGYSFPAGAMIVGLGAAMLVRGFRTFREKTPQIRIVDLIITAIVMLTTAVWILRGQPDPLDALGAGIGFGMLGEGIITRGPAVWDALAGKGGPAAAPSPAEPSPPVETAARAARPD
jgi:hypothetical protein